MIELIIAGGALAAGYVLAIYSWPALRTFLVGVDRELAWLKTRASELEAKLRAALGGDKR